MHYPRAAFSLSLFLTKARSGGTLIAAAIMKVELAGPAETQLEKEKCSASQVSCLCWTKVWAPNPLKQWKEINDTDDDKPRDQVFSLPGPVYCSLYPVK